MEIAEGGKLCAEAETSDGLPSAVTNLEMAICGGRNERQHNDRRVNGLATRFFRDWEVEGKGPAERGSGRT